MAEESLRKTLGVTDVFCIAVGAMISAGIFLLPGVAFSHIGPAIMFSYILGGIIAICGIFAILELATAMPQAGGIYYFTTRSLGPLAGTISGVLNWSALSLKSAFAIYGMSQIIHTFVPSINTVACGVGITIFFLIINLLSTEAAAWIERIMVYILIVIMALYVIFGMKYVELARFKPFFFEGKGVVDIFSEAGFIFVAFGGLLGVISVAEEVRNPGKSLPRGVLGGLAVVTVFYGLLMGVTIGVVSPEVLSTSQEPLANAANIYYGRGGYWMLTLGALLAFVTTGNAGIMGAARYPVALSRDGLLPGLFNKVYGKNKIPVPALLLTGGLMVGVQFLDLEHLVSVASTVVILSYILTNGAVLILRESGVMNYRPSFKTPLYPLMPLMCILVFSLMILRMGTTSIHLALFIVAGSIGLYYMYGRNVRRDSALMHLLGRLTQNTIESSDLERELRDVVRSRDEIQVDRFDEAIEDSEVMIIKEPITMVGLFNLVSKRLEEKFSIDSTDVSTRLAEREKISSTVIAPTVAVPHLTIQKENGLFSMMLVKAEQGIKFDNSENALPVETVVFLFCSPDEKNTHLKGLAMIAQVILDQSFDRRWKKAKTSQQLKDIFLLAHRLRAHSKK